MIRAYSGRANDDVAFDICHIIVAEDERGAEYVKLIRAFPEFFARASVAYRNGSSERNEKFDGGHI